MDWLCIKDNALSGSQMCIVTRPRIDLAIALIDRMKRLFIEKDSCSQVWSIISISAFYDCHPLLRTLF